MRNNLKKNPTIEDFDIVKIPDFIRYEEIERVLGRRMAKKFLKFMRGQTVLVYEGQAVYYPCDVNNFLHKGKLFFD